MGKIAIHISENYNRNSILKNRLMPSKIKLNHHLESFRATNFLNENEDKMLYMWLDSEKNEKFIKDMIYCKVWIAPRNKLSLKYDEDFIDFRNIKMDNLYPYTEMMYDIYKVINPNHINKDLSEIHCQEPSNNIHNACYQMDEYYAHNDKPLILSKEVERNIAIIGQAYMYVTKKNKVITKII